MLIKLSSFLSLRSSISSILFMNGIYATYIKGIKIWYFSATNRNIEKQANVMLPHFYYILIANLGVTFARRCFREFTGRPGARKFPGWSDKISCSPEARNYFPKLGKFKKNSQIFLFSWVQLTQIYASKGCILSSELFTGDTSERQSITRTMTRETSQKLGFMMSSIKIWDRFSLQH